MAELWEEVDGAWQRYDDVTGKSIGELVTIEQLQTLDIKAHTPAAGPGRSAAAVSKGAQSEFDSKVNAIREGLSMTEKMEDHSYRKAYRKYSAGIGYEDDPYDVPGVPGFVKSTGIQMLDMGREMTNNLNNFLDEIDISLLGGSETEAGAVLQREVDDRKAENEMFRVSGSVLDDATGPSELVGESLIPLLMGQGEIPLAKLAGTALSKVVKPSITKLSQMAPETPTREWFKRRASNILNKGEVRNPYMKEVGAQYTGAAAAGATEGALLDDRSAAEGMAEAMFGTHTGRSIASLIRRVEVEPTMNATKIRILNEADGLGKVYMPGVKTGNEKMQHYEAIMRGNPNMMNQIARFDAANADVDKRVLLETLGIDPRQLEGVELGDIIYNRIDELNTNMSNILPQIEGTISDAGLKRLQLTSDKYYDLENPVDRNAKGILDGYIRMFSRTGDTEDLVPTPDVLARRREVRTVESNEFYRTRSKLDAQIAQAHKTGDDSTYDALTSVRRELDASVKNKLRQKGGGLLEAFDTYNEQTTLLKTVANEGLDLDGNVNLKALNDYFMSSGGVDGKIGYMNVDASDPLYNLKVLAQADAVWRGRKSGGLSGSTQVSGFERGRGTRGMLERATNLSETPFQLMLLNSYRRGASAAGIASEAVGTGGRIGEAGMQGFGPHVEAARIVGEAADKLEGISDYVMKMFQGEEEEEQSTLGPSGASL